MITRTFHCETCNHSETTEGEDGPIPAWHSGYTTVSVEGTLPGLGRKAIICEKCQSMIAESLEKFFQQKLVPTQPLPIAEEARVQNYAAKTSLVGQPRKW